jgi:hypothetical protein
MPLAQGAQVGPLPHQDWVTSVCSDVIHPARGLSAAALLADGSLLEHAGSEVAPPGRRVDGVTRAHARGALLGYGLGLLVLVAVAPSREAGAPGTATGLLCSERHPGIFALGGDGFRRGATSGTP